VTSSVSWGNSHSSKPLPKEVNRKGCAKVKGEAEVSQWDCVARAPPEQLRARAAFILRQIDRRAPREPGEDDEIRPDRYDRRTRRLRRSERF
jgi:hypothetical protein